MVKRYSKVGVYVREAIATLLFFVALFFSYTALYKSTEVVLPSEGSRETLLFSNQSYDDLKTVYLRAIDEAKSSITLMTYTITDRDIIDALKNKATTGVDVTVITDAKASPQAVDTLPRPVKTVLRMPDGIMHSKALSIDGQKVYIGSANMTGESLRMHGNLIGAFYCSAMASYIDDKADIMVTEKLRSYLPPRSFVCGDQQVDVSFLPDDRDGVSKLKKLIASAQKSIKVAMFTWTRYDLADALITAYNRGIDVQVIVDRQSALGTSNRIVKKLANNGVPLSLNSGGGLLHHKFMIVDDTTLVNGSANWTLSAFNSNDDLFFVLYNLTTEQKDKLHDLWDNTLDDSTPYERR